MDDHTFLCIDLKSFYASVECVDRGLNPFQIPLVVADKTRGPGSIVLAVSPCLRKRGVPSRLRIYELPPDKDIVFAAPRMSRYLECSASVVDLLLDYVAEDDLHVYSIDESFLDVTRYLSYHACGADELALRIRNKIFTELGLTCTIGIGPNMLLAKVAMDLEAKHTSAGIAHWTKEDIERKLWPVRPLSALWGIGTQYERRLNALGIYSVYDLAHYPKKLLVDAFGIIGGQLHDHANGIDDTNIRETYQPENESLTAGQVLMKDYSIRDIPLIIQEELDDLVLRMIYQQKVCRNVSLQLQYASAPDKGFSHQIELPHPTDDMHLLYEALMQLFRKYARPHAVRKVSVSLNHLCRVEVYQTSLFQNPTEAEKKRKLLYTIARIKEKYGKNAVLRATSKLQESTIAQRHTLLGGHRK